VSIFFRGDAFAPFVSLVSSVKKLRADESRLERRVPGPTLPATP